MITNSIAEADEKSDLCMVPCKIFATSASLETSIKKASRNLKTDGFIHLLSENEDYSSDLPLEPSTTLGRAIESVRKIMKKLDHRLYQGLVYRKCENGKMVFKFYYRKYTISYHSMQIFKFSFRFEISDY